MQNTARKIFLRQFKQFRQRSLSNAASVASLKKDDFLIHSPMGELGRPGKGRLLDRLWIESAGFRNHVALESADSGKQYNYEQLISFSACFATSLRKRLGLTQGDVVAVMLPNSPEFVPVALGSIQAGCVLTTINPIYKEFEVRHQATLTNPKVLVTIPECYDTVVKGLREAKLNTRVILVDDASTSVPEGALRYSELVEKADADYSFLDTIDCNPDDVAVIPFSSGTTGLPKGVEITHGNLLAAMEMMAHEANSFPILAHGDHQDILPCIPPFFHIYGLVIVLLGHLTKGCKMVTMNKFSAGTFFNILERENSSLLYIVPPIAILLGKHPDVKPSFLRRVRHIICGAAPLAASDAEAVLAKSPRPIEFNQGYGTTETSSLVTTTPIGSQNVDYDAAGVPMRGVTLKVVDPTTELALPVGESGELYIKGPAVMKAYHKNEKATRESFTEDGFYKTGDMAKYVPGKGLYITDRIKELIKVKGMQVAPAELESLLRSHPAVADAAVIGVPHEFYGESPKAFVIKKQGQTISPEDIQDFVASKVASFKRIEEVVFVSDIPKTASGKILRKDLKKIAV